MFSEYFFVGYKLVSFLSIKGEGGGYPPIRQIFRQTSSVVCRVEDE